VGERKREKGGGRGLKDPDTATFPVCVCTCVCVIERGRERAGERESVLHCTNFLKHQYPSTTHPLFPTYPRTVRGPLANAVLLIYTEQMNRVHNSEEAPRSFTMAPCIVVERLEGKQRCSRAALGEQAGIQARE